MNILDETVPVPRRVGAAFAIGMVIGFAAGMIIGGVALIGQGVWEGGKRAGKREMEREFYAQMITIGDPTHDDCSVEVSLGTLTKLADLGVFNWIIACEEIRKVQETK